MTAYSLLRGFALTERVHTLDAVRTLETAPVLRTVKRTGALPPLSYGRPAPI